MGPRAELGLDPGRTVHTPTRDAVPSGVPPGPSLRDRIRFPEGSRSPSTPLTISKMLFRGTRTSNRGTACAMCTAPTTPDSTLLNSYEP